MARTVAAPLRHRERKAMAAISTRRSRMTGLKCGNDSKQNCIARSDVLAYHFIIYFMEVNFTNFIYYILRLKCHKTET